MLSVLIPVYNFDITPLVRSLHQQLSSESKPFEIILLDDGSQPSFKEVNRAVRELSHVVYEELPKNVGRSRIRNLMAQRARYDHLLYLDCDSELEDAQFIHRYVAVADGRTVVNGGRSYASTPPADATVFFRWKYGICRETVNATERNREPYFFFLSNNFLIPRTVMLRVPFNEKLSGYGHEDTLLAIELGQAGIPVRHIDNPARHIGLESAADFLGKWDQSIANLHRLMAQNVPMQHLKLVQWYLKLNHPPLRWLFTTGFKVIEPLVLRNLNGPNPSLFLFDGLRLARVLSYRP